MTELFRDSNSLGKSYVSGLKPLKIKGVISPRKEILFLAEFFLMDPFFLLASVFLIPFNSHFAPTFQNPMFLSSWGKESERSGLIFENFAHKGSKIVTANFFFMDCFFICSVRVNAFLPLFPEVQCPNFLNFRNPLGKVMKRFCLRFENFCF